MIDSGRMAEWQSGYIPNLRRRHRHLLLTETENLFLHSLTVSWQNGRTAERQNGGMAEWRNGGDGRYQGWNHECVGMLERTAQWLNGRNGKDNIYY
jgi:hypothetical protein